MKRKKILLIVINMVLFIALLASVFIPSGRKKAEFTNTDISEYASLDLVPRVGVITNQRQMELGFSLYDNQLYGIVLYFYFDGESTDGTIQYTLTSDESKEVLCQGSFPVYELAQLMDENNIKSKELIMEGKPELNGSYTLTLQGSGIEADTRISLYAVKSTERELEYKNSNGQNYNGIMYIMETVEKQHPYILDMAMLLGVSLMISVCIYSKERKREKAVEK